MQKEFSDILTERENLKRIIDSLQEGVIAHDKKRRIIFFNRAAEEITGFDRSEVIGRDCHEVFGTPFCGGKCSFAHGAPNQWEDKEYPLTILTKSGQSKRVEMRLTGMHDPSGVFYGVLAIFRDITDLLTLKILTGKLKGFAGIIGRNPKMLEVYRQIRDVASNDYPVHIYGETGTGKELVATAIHNESRRGGGPFVPVNCGALPEGILESELFGHVKGAFSGAVRDKKGRFELAHTGTLFLDEVTELPKSVQAKLLRVLQDGTFERVGGEKRISVDVRIISATNRNLKQEVKHKRFREDLFYRIHVVPIYVPPLRDRKDDIPLLVDHFLEQAKDEGHESSGISNAALSILTAYNWPGNIRELQSTIRFAVMKSKGKMILPKHLPMELQAAGTGLASKRGRSHKLDGDSVRTALLEAGGNKAKAARLLGVGRATLYRFLENHPDLTR